MSGIKLTAEFILILIATVSNGQKPSEKTSNFDTSIESYTVPVEIHSDESTNSQFQTEVEKQSTELFKVTTEIDRFATEKSNTYTLDDKLTTESEHISKTVTEQASTGKILEIEETVADTTTREPETRTVTSFESVTNAEPTQGSTVTETLLRTTKFADPDVFKENPDTNEDRTVNFEEFDDKMNSDSEDLNYYKELLSTRRMMMYGNDQQNVILDTKMRNAEKESVEPIYSPSAPVDNVNNFFKNQLGTIPVVNKQRLFPQFFPAVAKRPEYFNKPEFIKAAAPLLLTKIVKPDLQTALKPNPVAIRQNPPDRQSIEDFNMNVSDNAYPYLPLYDNEKTKSIQSQTFKTETKSNEDFPKLPQANPFNDVFAKLVEASKHPTGEVIKKYGNIPDNILNRRIIGFTQDHIGYSKEILARALQSRLLQKHVLLPYFLQ